MENAAQKIGVGRSKRLHKHCLSSPRILMVKRDCGYFVLLPRDFQARRTKVIPPSLDCIALSWRRLVGLTDFAPLGVAFSALAHQFHSHPLVRSVPYSLTLGGCQEGIAWPSTDQATDPRSQARSRHRRIEATSVEGGRGHAVGLYAPLNGAGTPLADPPASRLFVGRNAHRSPLLKPRQEAEFLHADALRSLLSGCSPQPG